MNTKPLFAGPITVENAGIFNGTTKATLRDDAGLVAEVYTYGNNDSDIEQVKKRAAVLAAGPKLLDLARAYLAALESSDAEHPEFLDSCADSIDLLWNYRPDEVRRLINEAEGTPQ